MQGSVFASEKEDVSVSPVTAVSPEDGSLWIATPSDGLYRLGHNGRTLHYSVGSGHLKSDAIQCIVFDASGILYILDGTGSLSRYSSINGFSSVPAFESGVSALSESAGIPYIIKDSLLYSLSGDSSKLVRTLPFSISSGVLPEPEYEEEVLPVAPLEEEDTPGFGLWALILSLVAGVCIGAVSAWIIGRGKKTDKPAVKPEVKRMVEPMVKPVVVVEPEAKPVEVEPDAEPVDAEPVVVPSEQKSVVDTLQESDFGRQVLDLFTAHLSDSNYGVEQIAEDLGITRIHVNRKLKAQTGYSPSTVFKNIRMTEASRLLLEGQLSVSEIAKRCGFSTLSYFSTAFKDYFGQSPSEFLAAHSSSSL